jgi:nitrite reductase/ring-hydroxylating ferredoxin subunit
MDTEIECPFHQGRFDIRTGQPTGAPCTEALRVWTVHVIDGRICIDPAEHRGAGNDHSVGNGSVPA